VRVYAIIVLILYNWTIIYWLTRLPGWRVFLTPWEILGILDFSLTTALLESLLVLCLPMIVAVCLPRPWFGDSFVARGGALVAAVLAYMMFLDIQFKHEMLYPALPLSGWVLVLPLVLIVPLVLAAGRITALRRAVEALAERATIFLYIMLPLSGISVILLLARSLISVVAS